MLHILLLLCVSMGIGFLLRQVRFVSRFSEAVQYTVYTMLLVFGLTIGSNRQVMSRLGEYGLQATLIAVAGVAGSILAIYLYNRIYERKGGKS